MLCKEYFKLLFFRGMQIWPALIFCLWGFSSVIYHIGSGPAWIEYDDLFKQCDVYWWTPLFFVNDLVPWFAKDLSGCMRWTAYFAIEMKLFLALPIAVYFFHIGHQFVTTVVCSCMVGIGLFIYGSVLFTLRIHPGYLSYFDYQAFDLVHLKPWNHIDSYFCGILMSFLYQKVKFYRFIATE